MKKSFKIYWNLRLRVGWKDFPTFPTFSIFPTRAVNEHAVLSRIKTNFLRGWSLSTHPTFPTPAAVEFSRPSSLRSSSSERIANLVQFHLVSLFESISMPPWPGIAVPAVFPSHKQFLLHSAHCFPHSQSKGEGRTPHILPRTGSWSSLNFLVWLSRFVDEDWHVCLLSGFLFTKGARKRQSYYSWEWSRGRGWKEVKIGWSERETMLRWRETRGV